jgi:hypothetical protein
MGVPEGADLMITPISAPENHYFNIKGKSTILADGTLKGNLFITAEGQSDASLRGLFTRSQKQDWNARLERELLEANPMLKVESMSYGNPYDYSKPIEIKINYTIPDYAIVTNNEIIFIPFVATNLFKHYNTHLSFDTQLEKREQDFRDRCTRQVKLAETVTLPYEAEFVNYPDSLESSGTGADFKGYYSINGNQLNLFESANYKKRVYSKDDWDSYKEAVANQNKYAKEYIILRKK